MRGARPDASVAVSTVAVAVAVLVGACGARPRVAPAIDRLPVAAPPVQVTLDNGLRLVRATGDPSLVTMALLVAGGPISDPRDLPGLTDALATAALLGTSGDRGPEWPPARTLLDHGATVLPVSDGKLVGWVASGPSSAMDALLRTLTDLAMGPTFPAVQLDNRLEIMREEADAAGDEDFHRALSVVVGVALGLARPLPLAVRADTVTDYHRERLLRHWSALFRPERAVLVLVGGPSDTNLHAMASRQLAGWSRSESPGGRVSVCAPKRLTSHVILAPDASTERVQAFLALQAPGPGDARRAATEALVGALNTVPGGAVAGVVGNGRAERTRLRLLDLGPDGGTGASVLLAVTSGPAATALTDLYGLVRLLSDVVHTPPDTTEAEAVRQTEMARAADHPLSHAIGLGAAALYRPTRDSRADETPSGPSRQTAVGAADVFQGHRIAVAGVGPVALGEVLGRIGPVTVWNGAGAPIAGAQPPRCRPPEPAASGPR